MSTKKPLDLRKVEEALKRAARAAISGSREERSGRLLPRSPEKNGASPNSLHSSKSRKK